MKPRRVHLGKPVKLGRADCSWGRTACGRSTFRLKWTENKGRVTCPECLKAMKEKTA